MPARQRAGKSDALPLTTGELVGLALLQPLELDQPNHFRNARRDIGTRHAGALEAEGDVVTHRQMRKQRVILEHHVDRALMRQRLRDVLAAEQDAPLIRRLEAREHA